MFTTLLAIHGRTTKAIAAMSRSLIRIAIACIGRIHGSAILRRIHRSALRLRAIARACHLRTALRLRTGSIAIPLLAGARLVTWRSGRRRVHFGSCGRKRRSRWRRLVCRFCILSLQRRDAESERTAKPGKSVGFEFHVSVLFRLATEE